PRTKLGNTGPPYKRPRTDITRAESPEIEQMEPTGSLVETSANSQTVVMEVMAKTIGDQAATIKGLQNEIRELRALIESMSKNVLKSSLKVAEIKSVTKKTFAEVAGVGTPRTAPTVGQQASQSKPSGQTPARQAKGRVEVETNTT